MTFPTRLAARRGRRDASSRHLCVRRTEAVRRRARAGRLAARRKTAGDHHDARFWRQQKRRPGMDLPAIRRLGLCRAAFRLSRLRRREGERGRVIPVEEVADACNAVTYMAARADVDPEAIALCGSSLGGGVAVQAAGLDPRVAAVIVENGVANGERMIRSMHSAESWAKFRALLDDIAAHRERTGTTKMIHRFDIFEMPKVLQVNLSSNGSLMQFTGETAIGFFMFRPEEFVALIGPRPLPILPNATPTVAHYQGGFAPV